MKFVNSLRNLFKSKGLSARQFARTVGPAARGSSTQAPQESQEIASSRLPRPTPIPRDRRSSSRA